MTKITQIPQKCKDVSLISKLAQEFLKKDYNFKTNSVLGVIEFACKNKNQFEILDGPLFSGLLIHLRNKYQLGISGAEAKHVVVNPLFSKPYNPFIDYFDGLKKIMNEQKYTTGEYINKVCTLIPFKNSKDKEYYKKHQLKWCVRVIKSVYQPDYFNKHTLIFTGKGNGIGKSYFCKQLCPEALRGKYYKSTVRMNSSVDKDRALAMSLIINLDEVERLTKTRDAQDIKAFISQDTITTRMPHATFDTYLNRNASFLGTCNSLEFLRKNLGYDRWVGFELSGKFTRLPKKEMSELMAGLWVEATYQYFKDLNFGDMTYEDTNILKNRAENFTEVSIEEEALHEVFTPSSKSTGGIFYTGLEILNECTRLCGVKLNSTGFLRALKSGDFEKVRYLKNKTGQVRGFWVKKISDMVDNFTEETKIEAQQAELFTKPPKSRLTFTDLNNVVKFMDDGTEKK